MEDGRWGMEDGGWRMEDGSGVCWGFDSLTNAKAEESTSIREVKLKVFFNIQYTLYKKKKSHVSKSDYTIIHRFNTRIPSDRGLFSASLF